MTIYYVQYEERRDKWCIIYFAGRDIKIHSTYNTLIYAKECANKLNETESTKN